jgi:hypothetical protein
MDGKSNRQLRMEEECDGRYEREYESEEEERGRISMIKMIINKS